MLQVHQISKEFGRTQAVDNLSFSVEKGQICGLLGPNGAGKTTAIRMICGVLIPSSGHIEMDGLSLGKHPIEVKKIVGYVPEGAPLPLELRPIEYLSHVASLYGIQSNVKVESISAWAHRCDITSVLKKPIGSLSRGFRQRVALVAALLHQPRVVILDEPSTGLDPEQRSTFYDLLKDVSSNAAILYSSHHLDEVEQTCDDVIIINHGRLIDTHSFENAIKTDMQTVEVSSLQVAQSLNGENIVHLENGWIRCSVRLERENIVEAVEQFGGNVRLIQPFSLTLESKYLSLIRASNIAKRLGDEE